MEEFSSIIDTLSDVLPKDLAWMAFDFCADDDERCQLCGELFREKDLNDCEECEQTFHTSCLVFDDNMKTFQCNSCRVCCECLEDLTDLNAWDYRTCDICEKSWHFECADWFDEDRCEDCV